MVLFCIGHITDVADHRVLIGKRLQFRNENKAAAALRHQKPNANITPIQSFIQYKREIQLALNIRRRRNTKVFRFHSSGDCPIVRIRGYGVLNCIAIADPPIPPSGISNKFLDILRFFIKVNNDIDIRADNAVDRNLIYGKFICRGRRHLKSHESFFCTAVQLRIDNHIRQFAAGISI